LPGAVTVPQMCTVGPESVEPRLVSRPTAAATVKAKDMPLRMESWATWVIAWTSVSGCACRQPHPRRSARG